MKNVKRLLMLEQALAENDANLLAERRLSGQHELMLARVEIMKSIIAVQGEIIEEMSEYKEAA